MGERANVFKMVLMETFYKHFDSGQYALRKHLVDHIWKIYKNLERYRC